MLLQHSSEQCSCVVRQRVAATGNYEPVTLPQSLVDRVIEDGARPNGRDFDDDPHIVAVASRQ